MHLNGLIFLLIFLRYDMTCNASASFLTVMVVGFEGLVCLGAGVAGGLLG